MNLISHRRNTIEELSATPHTYGIEVDIRSFGDKLIIHHEPMVEGEDFISWLKIYKHGTLILNVKEEGLEEPLIRLMKEYNIDDFFFLDQSFPFLIKWAKQGERRCAVRLSEFESIETVMSLAGKVDWVWVDCFTHFPLNKTGAEKLKKKGFKLCLVSPELQGRNAETEIPQLVKVLREQYITPEAICTKRPDLWENNL